MSNKTPEGFREGPRRYYVPVCVRWWHGYIGGPIGYEYASGPVPGPIIIVNTKRPDAEQR